MTTRYLEKFESENGTISVTLPLFAYEYASRQSLIVPIRQVSGASYAYPLRGNTQAIKAIGTESANFAHVEDFSFAALENSMDALKYAAITAAIGWIYLLADDGTRRRARGFITDVPEMTIGYTQGLSIPAMVSWIRLTDWQSPDLIVTDPITLDDTPLTFSMDIEGNAPCYDAVIEIFGVFTNPKLVNETNGYTLESTRDGALGSDSLRFDAGRNRVEFSDDTQATYVPDFANFVRADRQIQLMRLDPGTDDFEYTDGGAPGATVIVQYHPHWH